MPERPSLGQWLTLETFNYRVDNHNDGDVSLSCVVFNLTTFCGCFHLLLHPTVCHAVIFAWFTLLQNAFMNRLQNRCLREVLFVLGFFSEINDRQRWDSFALSVNSVNQAVNQIPVKTCLEGAWFLCNWEASFSIYKKNARSRLCFLKSCFLCYLSRSTPEKVIYH